MHRVDNLKQPKARSHINLKDILLYLFVLFIAISIMILLYVWQTQFVIRLSQKELDNMDLDLIKSITKHSMLKSVADLSKDTTMEIRREDVTVLEALGEGAFGLVKKAILRREGKTHQVAVKMLKSKLINFRDLQNLNFIDLLI
jgi:hypothetical protein